MPKTGRENWGEDQHLLTFFRGGKTKKQSILPWRAFPRARPAESLSSEASPGDGTGFVGKAAPGAQGHRGVSPARRPRSAATGAEQAAEGEVRETRTAQSFPFPAVLREGKKNPSTESNRKPTQEAGQGAPGVAEEEESLVPSHLLAELPGIPRHGGRRVSRMLERALVPTNDSVQTKFCAHVQ